MKNITDYLKVFKNINEGPRITAQEPRNMYAGGQLVRNTVDGSRPGYRGRPGGNPAFGTKEFSEKRDVGKDIPKIRKYLRTILRRKDSITFEDIKDLKKKAGLSETSKVDADVSRLINDEEFKGKVFTKATAQMAKYGNRAEQFRNILRDMQELIPKGKKEFINIAFTAKKHKLPGNPNSGAYSRVLQEPEFKNFVVLTKDKRSNPNIIEFAKQFEILYEDGVISEKELAQNIYGNTSVDSLKKVRADASKYAEFLYGVRDVTDADGKRLKLPSVEKRGDYLFELIDELEALEEGEKGKVRQIRYNSGIMRDRMFAIRDGLLGLKEGETDYKRTKIKKLLKKGYNLDEIAGLSATHELAPGYTELVQGMKAKINKKKMTEIDKPFSRIFEQVITGQKPTKGFKYGKKFYQDINEVVKLYNKDAAAYGKKYNIDVPLIEYDPRPGKKVNPKNFLPNFKYLSPAAQANVKELADKGIGIRTEGVTLQQMQTKDFNLKPRDHMKLLKRMGYRCLKAGGAGETVECYMDDVKKTRADLKSSNVEVRAMARTKQRKALQLARTIPGIAKMLRRGIQGTLGVVGLNNPIGWAVEGLIEGGIYDYYRRKGYDHNQAFAETFTPRLAYEGFQGKSTEDVPWYGGSEKLREKELYGVREAPTILEDGTIVEGDLIPGKVQPKVKRYVDALEEQDRIYDAIARKEGARDDYDLAEASADVQDLARSGAYRRVDQTLAPESMASQAYNIAVEKRDALDQRRRKDYLEKYDPKALEREQKSFDIYVRDREGNILYEKPRSLYKKRYEEMEEYKGDREGIFGGMTRKEYEKFQEEMPELKNIPYEDQPKFLQYLSTLKAKPEGFDKTYKELFPTPASRYDWDLMGEIARAGGVANMAGGGMVGIRKPHAIPPKRQGLRSIMINVNDD